MKIARIFGEPRCLTCQDATDALHSVGYRVKHFRGSRVMSGRWGRFWSLLSLDSKLLIAGVEVELQLSDGILPILEVDGEITSYEQWAGT